MATLCVACGCVDTVVNKHGQNNYTPTLDYTTLNRHKKKLSIIRLNECAPYGARKSYFVDDFTSWLPVHWPQVAYTSK